MINEVSGEKGFHCPVDKNNNPQFDFNAAVVELYTKEDCNPFEGTSDEEYLCQLLTHWRMFNQAKVKSAKYYHLKKETDSNNAPTKDSLAFFADGKMTVDQLSTLQVKKSATHKDYTIVVMKDNKVVVCKGDEYYDNTKGVLREIAEKLGFEVDPKWNTQQFGSKLVDFLNSK